MHCTRCCISGISYFKEAQCFQEAKAQGMLKVCVYQDCNYTPIRLYRRYKVSSILCVGFVRPISGANALLLPKTAV